MTQAVSDEGGRRREGGRARRYGHAAVTKDAADEKIWPARKTGESGRGGG